MKRSLLSICMGCAMILSAEVIYRNPMTAKQDWSTDAGAEFTKEGLTLTTPKKADYLFASEKLPVEQYAGKILRVTAEVRGSNLFKGPQRFDGAKIQFCSKGRKTTWDAIQIPIGTFPWKTFRKEFYIPEDATSLKLDVFFQSGGGTFTVRNLKVEVLGTALDIPSVANMGLKDEKAGDGKGGWTDQGPNQDGRNFAGQMYRQMYSGIPLHAEPAGKVLTMYSDHFPVGKSSVTVPVKRAVKAKNLYLLHTLAWAGGKIGTITLKDVTGKTQTFTAFSGVDAADWYKNISYMKNGYPVLTANSKDQQKIAAYCSKFKIDPSLKEITEVTFTTEGNSIWLILGGTLTQEDILLPAQRTYTVKAGDKWHVFQYPKNFRIKPGSALDVEDYMDKRTVDQHGRMIIRDGHFVSEKEPEKPVRFLTCAITPHALFMGTHETVTNYIQELKRNGYNMIRTHFLDFVLMTGAKKDLDFNQKYLDNFDYMIAEMKKNGIYLNFDLMTSWIGYTPGDMWKKRNPKEAFKHKIAFDKKVQDNWLNGVKKIMLRVNPYTKTRLINDPVLVMAVGYNEQEFGFWREFDEKLIKPYWHEFLRKRYGTIGKLKAAWGGRAKKFKDFDSIPCFKPHEVRQNKDVDLFRNEHETRILKWYQDQMKQMGFKGYVTGYNCGKDQTYNVTRREVPFVAMNHYHAHPNQYISRNSSLSQDSPSETRLEIFRSMIGTRQALKPFVVTEYNVVFWNRFRYEQAFAIGAYAALQGFDALTTHAQPVWIKAFPNIQPFQLWMDPVMKANEFLTFFLFSRGDVKEAAQNVRIRVRETDIMQSDAPKGGLSTEQGLLSLITGVSMEIIGPDGKTIPLRKNEMAFKLGTPEAVIVNTAGFSSTVDNQAANASDVVKLFRQKKLIPANNRSDGLTRFESVTGEIYLDMTKKYIEINTPRLQGICATADTKAKLSDLEVEKMSVNGNIAVVSIDGMQPIRKARRMMLVYSTNALNNNQTFTSPEMNTLYSIGRLPGIIECGAFTVAIRHETPEKLRMYPLDLAGNRLAEKKPFKVAGGKAWFTADMAKENTGFFYEITAESPKK